MSANQEPTTRNGVVALDLNQVRSVTSITVVHPDYIEALEEIVSTTQLLQHANLAFGRRCKKLLLEGHSPAERTDLLNDELESLCELETVLAAELDAFNKRWK